MRHEKPEAKRAIVTLFFIVVILFAITVFVVKDITYNKFYFLIAFPPITVIVIFSVSFIVSKKIKR
jgi:hypothetical protein